MIGIRMALDTKPYIKQLTALESKQIPYSVVVALNRTVEDALARARKEIQQRFIVRVPGFILPPVQLPKVWRATKQNPFAIFALGDSDGGAGGIGARRSKILSKFQDGGTKSASNPAFPIAIPTKALRPSPRGLVPRQLYPKNLRLAPRRGSVGTFTTAGGKRKHIFGTLPAQEKGKFGAFIIRGTEGNSIPLGIFQRTGPGKKDIRMIWAFEQSIHIPKRLDWEGIAQRTAEERWAPNFEGALALAIRTQK